MQVSSPRTPAEQRELARRLAAFFRCMASAANRDLLPEVSELDLSLTQLKALAALEAHGEGLSVKDLSERLGLSLAAGSRAVDGLVKRGLVERAEDADDRRVRRVALAARGRRVVERLGAIRVAGLERLLGHFDEAQREKLSEALTALFENEEVRRFYRPERRSR
jgi:DNA-binding MarR family transcriptional regulator